MKLSEQICKSVIMLTADLRDQLQEYFKISVSFRFLSNHYTLGGSGWEELITAIAIELYDLGYVYPVNIDLSAEEMFDMLIRKYSCYAERYQKCFIQSLTRKGWNTFKAIDRHTRDNFEEFAYGGDELWEELTSPASPKQGYK